MSFKKRSSIFIGLAVALSAFSPLAAESVHAQAAAPTIASDKADYMPGEHVILTGANWQPGETVNIDVNDTEGQSWRRNVDVMADDGGGIRDEFNLPDWFVATYSVVATGPQSGTATTSFTDGNVSVQLAGGPTSALVNWETFGAQNTTCGGAGTPGSTTVNNTEQTILASVPANRSIEIVAPAISGYAFSGWSGAASSTANTLCLATTGPAQALTATFSPTIAATSLSVASASGTYGGTTNLSATLTSGGSGVGGKTISFTLNGSPAGTAATNAIGVATLVGASLSGINAGSYPTGVGAAFAGDSSYSSSSGTNSLTVNPASQAITFTSAAPAGAVYGDTYTPSATGGGSGNPVTFGASGACAYASGTVTMTSTGTCTVTADQAGSSNYNAAPQATQVFAVGQRPITGSFTADNKVYDGTTSATVLTRSLSGVIPSDVVTLDGGTATFDNKNVGTGKTVTLTGASLGGDDAGKYTLTSVNTALASITARDLTVTATGVDKIYDGTPTATVNLSTDKLAGDNVTAAYTSATFDNENVGTSKPVSVSGISISGADAGNYNLTNTTANTTANITPLGITGSFTAADKVYDGTTSASVLTRSLIGAITGDDVSLTGGTATFDTPNVGTGKTVTLSGATLDGPDAGNYILLSVATTTASILPWNAQGYGFYSPVGVTNTTFVPAPGLPPSAGPSTIWNTIKGGSTVPLKFEVFAGESEQTSTSAISHFTAYKIPCPGGSGNEDSIDFVRTGGTSLRYDTTDGQFLQNWKSPSGAGCYRVTVTFADGSSLTAFFKAR